MEWIVAHSGTRHLLKFAHHRVDNSGAAKCLPNQQDPALPLSDSHQRSNYGPFRSRHTGSLACRDACAAAAPRPAPAPGQFSRSHPFRIVREEFSDQELKDQGIFETQSFFNQSDS